MQHSMQRSLVAEFLGTFWLVLGGCGSAVLPPASRSVGIGLLGVSLAFGLTVLTMAYAIGHISGCHLNPAVTLGLGRGRPLPGRATLVPYIVAQVLGAVAGGGGALPDRERQGRASTSARAASPRTATTRTRRAATRCAPALRRRGGPDVLLPDRHPGRHRRARAGRLRADRDRPLPHADPPDQHPGDQHLGEPGAQHRARRSSSAAGRSRSSGSSGWRRSWAGSSAAPSTATSWSCPRTRWTWARTSWRNRDRRTTSLPVLPPR